MKKKFLLLILVVAIGVLLAIFTKPTSLNTRDDQLSWFPDPTEDRRLRTTDLECPENDSGCLDVINIWMAAHAKRLDTNQDYINQQTILTDLNENEFRRDYYQIYYKVKHPDTDIVASTYDKLVLSTTEQTYPNIIIPRDGSPFNLDQILSVAKGCAFHSELTDFHLDTPLAFSSLKEANQYAKITMRHGLVRPDTSSEVTYFRCRRSKSFKDPYLIFRKSKAGQCYYGELNLRTKEGTFEKTGPCNRGPDI